MRKLAELSVRYPTTVLMAVLAVIVLGLISFGRLGMDLFPRLDSPRLYVEIEAGERPPEEMETQFVSRLESLAARGRNVVNVISSSRVGKALITVEYQWNADMDEAFLDLQKSVGDFGSTSGADSITVSPLDPNARPVVTAAFRHDQIVSLDALRQTAETIIRNELVRLPGVAAVDLVGDRKREIVVRTDDFALQAYGLTMDALATTIQGFNSNLTGGSIVEMGIRYTIRGVGELSSLDDLRKLILVYKTTTQGGVEVRTPVTLSDVAEVRYEESEPENIIRFNGAPCLGLEIFKEAGFNTTEVSKEIRDALAGLQASMPGYRIDVVEDDAAFIKSAIGEVKNAAIYGGVLAVLVLFLFLRRVSVTAVISLTIPVSLVATFGLMYFSGLTLNLMTLSGLALCVGNLIDNSIVVVENIFRHVESGVVRPGGVDPRDGGGGRGRDQLDPDHDHRLPPDHLSPWGRRRAFQGPGPDRDVRAGDLAHRRPDLHPDGLLPRHEAARPLDRRPLGPFPLLWPAPRTDPQEKVGGRRRRARPRRRNRGDPAAGRKRVSPGPKRTR